MKNIFHVTAVKSRNWWKMIDVKQVFVHEKISERRKRNVNICGLSWHMHHQSHSPLFHHINNI
jgi:hypothetical protein